MTIRTMALVLAAGAAMSETIGAEAKETPLFELVPVPPEYAAVPMLTPTPTPTPSVRRRARPPVPPPPVTIVLPAVPTVTPPPPRYFPPSPPAPPMVPPPPFYPATSEHPTPRGSPQAWITNDDYPAAALRAEQSGIVRFRLNVDEMGRVVGCIITESSGSSLLDTTTCSLMRRRARFTPPLDAKGRPLSSTWPSRMRWEIPQDPVVPLVSWVSTLRFTIAVGGKVSRCSFQSYAAPGPEESAPCADVLALSPKAMRALRGRSRGPVTIVARFDHAVDGVAGPRLPALSARFKRVAQWSGHYDVNLSGVRLNCVGDIDNHILPVPATTCHSDTSYGRQDVAHKVTVTMRFFTDGDARIVGALPMLEAAGAR